MKRKLLVFGALIAVMVVTMGMGPPEEGPSNAEKSVAVAPRATCTVGASEPLKVGVIIYGIGSISCSPPVTQVRLKVYVKRHLTWIWWTTIASVDTGWQNGTSLARIVGGLCTSGTHTYRVDTKAYSRNSSGGSVSSHSMSEQDEITC